jgi:tRNA pseudouridine65 synthase
VIDHPLSRRFDDYGRKLTPESTAEALPAVTGYRRLATVELPEAVERYPTSRYALLELIPKRPPAPVAPPPEAHRPPHHRRRQLGQGHPQPLLPARFGCGRLLLACTQIELRHPQDGRNLAIEAPLEEGFARVADALGWSGIVR